MVDQNQIDAKNPNTRNHVARMVGDFSFCYTSDLELHNRVDTEQQLIGLSPIVKRLGRAAVAVPAKLGTYNEMSAGNPISAYRPRTIAAWQWSLIWVVGLGKTYPSSILVTEPLDARAHPPLIVKSVI